MSVNLSNIDQSIETISDLIFLRSLSESQMDVHIHDLGHQLAAPGPAEEKMKILCAFRVLLATGKFHHLLHNRLR